MVLTASGKILATCVEEDVAITDVKSLARLATIESDGEAITSLSISPSGSHLIVCSRSVSMRIYALTLAEDETSMTTFLLRSLKPHQSPVVSTAIDDTGTLLATGGADGVVKVWDIRGGFVTHTFHGHAGVVSALRFFETTTSPLSKDASSQKQRKRKSNDMDGMDIDLANSNSSILLASGSEDGKIRINDLNKRKAIATLDSHVSVVRSLDYSPHQNLLLSTSRDKTLILWDTKRYKPTKVMSLLEVVETAAFLHTGEYCFSGGENGYIRLWETLSGREVTDERPAMSESDIIIGTAYSEFASLLISIHQDQTLRLYNTKPLIRLQSSSNVHDLPLLTRIFGTHDEIIDLAPIGSDASLLALATNTESVRLVTGPTSSDDWSIGQDAGLLTGHTNIIICLTTDQSGQWLATGAKDNTARLWRLDLQNKEYKSFATFEGHTESIGAIALPDSSSSSLKDALSHPPAYLITGSQDKTIKQWDLSKLRVSDPHVEPHAITKASYTRVAHEKDINSIDISPSQSSSTTFASASQDRTIKIWDAESGSTIGILRGHKRGVWSIKYAPANAPPLTLAEGGNTGKHGFLVSGSGDRSVKVWSLSSFTCLMTFEGHGNSVLKVIWLPPPNVLKDDENEDLRGHRRKTPIIASSSSDTLIKLWDPYVPISGDSDNLLATLDNHTDRVWALAPGGPSAPYSLISGAADATVTFWKDTSSQTATLATQRATERIEQDQDLQNAINAKKYREAIVLSLQLNHPARLLSVLQAVTNIPPAQQEEGSLMGIVAVDEVLSTLSYDQLWLLLQRVRDWNTNARTAGVSQRVLNCLLKKYPSSTWTEMAKIRRFAGIKELTRALEVYTERHFKRIEELVDESYLLDYTLGEMDEIVGNGEMASEGMKTITNGTTGNSSKGHEDVMIV